ncbi:phage tail fiber protein [Caballeronia sp. LZ033]|uniref:phage tail fiber domain-containing protein n=1 Tax=Caballeronia sp. LZ033 TaxID=3038566 RepID=UPI002865FA81|nr:phage tail fiber protein [Caballeronia sp. LZ033]MDR5812019.1 phage tail fiber protein [Caballeronia sp. LZ033]
MLTTYTTDGSQTVFTFDWPYLDRTHVFVTVNEAPRPFVWVDDYTLKITTTFGDPFESGLTLKIFRATPDVVSFAEFKDNSNLTADDLNRARLQVLFLIQERSGGIAGYVGQAIQSVTNDLQSISGALGDLQYIRGVLEAGLQTLDDLQASITRIDNGAKSLQDQIDAEIKERVDAGAILTTQVNTLSSTVDNRLTTFSSQVQLLQSSNDILANKQDVLEAKFDNLDLTPLDPTDDRDDALIAASIISTAVTGVKLDLAQKQQIEAYAHDISTLEATIDQNWIDAQALVQTEREARVEADTNVAGQISAITEQITTLQSTVDDNIAQVVQTMQTQVDTINGKVTNLNAQYVLKVQVQRTDGRPVVAGIGLAATSNGDVTNSEIILTANRLLFVDPAAPDGVVKPIFESGLVDGANTFVIPANVLGDKKYPGRLLVDGAIDTRTLAANAVTADKIVAGAISTDKLQVGLGVNLLQFSEMFEGGGDLGGARGWHYSSSPNRDISVGFSVAQARIAFPTYNVVGGNTSYMLSTWTNGVTDLSGYEFVYSDAVPVVGGSWYECSTYFQNARCEADIGIMWLDGNGAQIASSGFKGAAGFSSAYSANGQGAGFALSQYGRMGGRAQAPGTAVSARLAIRKGFHAAADGNSYLFWVKPMLAQTFSNTSVLSPYSPGGLGTTITPYGISTPSLSALSATIGLLRTSASGQRLEIDSNQIRVYDANNVQRVLFGVW